MPENIESFVKKLQDEGVNAGKKAAENIINEAKREAEELIADARNHANDILAKAKHDSELNCSRVQTELELAVRDTILKLREVIGQVISSMLSRKIENILSAPDYLREIIREVILAYVRADAALNSGIKINISEKMGENFKNDILENLLAITDLGVIG